VRRATALLAAVAVLAGCGSSDEPAETEAAAGGGAFPAKVEHKFGVTTVPAKPKRIVVVGLTEQDVVLELGFKPIATTEWYGEQPYAVWPWAREALGDAKPTVLHTDDGFEFEKIAALQPDLIIGVNAGIKREDYDKLSRLAPTVASPKGSTDYFSPWDRQVELIAAALGKPDEGKQLVREVEDAYAAAAEAHPEFRATTATFAQNGFYSGLLYVYPPGLNTEFLTMLGFEINPKLEPLVEREGEQVGISPERLDVIDTDVILFATEKASDVAALEKVPTFGKLRAVAENRSVYTDGTLAGAIYFMTPLSLKYVLERLPEQLADAVAGKAPRRVVDSK
jgi:iron complex transport system substrate-binding protein